MPTHISLLRGVNVGGHRKIRMAELKALYKSLGFDCVRTYVQSGNVVYDADSADSAALAARIEAAIAERFGFDVTVIQRAPDDFARILDANPYPEADPKFLHVLFLAAPAPAAIDGLFVPTAGDEAWHWAGQEIYLHYPHGSARSKMTGGFFEKALSIPATARNWNSVNALHRLAMG